jgi:hypothetical protein
VRHATATYFRAGLSRKIGYYERKESGLSINL